MKNIKVIFSMLLCSLGISVQGQVGGVGCTPCYTIGTKSFTGCPGQSINVNPGISPGSIIGTPTFSWSGPLVFSSPTSLSTSVTVPTVPTVCTLTVKATCPSMMCGGTFPVYNSYPGNCFTGEYSLTDPADEKGRARVCSLASQSVPGSYCADFGDHSTPSDNMLCVNGKAGSTVWAQTFPVCPNTDYQFSYWSRALSGWAAGSGDQPIMQVRFYGSPGGSTSGSPTAPPDQPLWSDPATQCGGWHQYTIAYHSNIATSLTISMEDLCGSSIGNDFALDDISMQGNLITEYYVTINPVPTPTVAIVAGPPAACVGVAYTYTITSTSGGTANYNITGPFTGSPLSAVNVPFNGLNQIYVTVTPTAIGNICLNVSSTSVAGPTETCDFPLSGLSACVPAGYGPGPITITAPAAKCQNDADFTVAASSSGAAAYTWGCSGAGTISGSSGATASVHLTGSAGAISINCTATNACGTVTATAATTVNPNPVFSINSSNNNPCSGSVYTLSATALPLGGAPYTFSWDFGPTTNPAVHPAITTTVPVVVNSTLTVENKYHCSTTNSYSLTVWPLPNGGHIDGPEQICEEEIATLTNSTGTAGGVWTSSNPGVATVGGATGVVTGISAGTVTITYTANTVHCGSDYSVKAITVKVKPIATVSVLGTCTPVCPGNPIYITITGTPGATVEYYTSLTSGPLYVTLPTGTLTFTAPLTVPSNFIFYTGIVTFNGCSRDYKKAKTIVPIDNPKCNLSVFDPTVYGPFTFPMPQYMPCGNEPYYIKVEGYPGDYYVGTTDLTTGLPSSFVMTIPAGGTYAIAGPFVIPDGHVVGTQLFCVNKIVGCCTVVSTEAHTLCCLNVVSRGLPHVALLNAKICEDEELTLQCKPMDACAPPFSTSAMIMDWCHVETLTWVGPGLATTTTMPPPPPGYPFGVSDAFLTVSPTPPAGTYTYSVTATDFSPWPDVLGCANTATNTVIVNPLPAPIDPTAIPNVLCLGTSWTFTDAAPGGIWSSDNACITIDAITGVALANYSGTTIIRYTFPTGCDALYKVTVPKNGIVKEQASLCGAGGTITLPEPYPGGTWSSSNTGVATVDASGLVTGISAGTAVITYDLSPGCFPIYYTYLTVAETPWACIGIRNDVYCQTCHYIDPPHSPYTVCLNGFRIYGEPVGAEITYSIVSLAIPYTGASCTAATGVGTLTASVDPITGNHYFDALPVGLYTTPLYGDPVIYCQITPVTLTGISVYNSDGSTCYTGSLSCSMSHRPASHSSDSEANSLSNASALTIVPNPTTGSFTLSGTLSSVTSEKEAAIEITDMLGKAIFTRSVHVNKGGLNEHFNMNENVANGIYLIKVRTDNETKVLRFTLDR